MDKRVVRCNHLIKKIQKENEKALEDLFQEFGLLFLNMAKKYLFDKNHAEDLISEVFVDLVKNSAKSFDENKNGLNWIFTIIRNKAYHYNQQFAKEVSLDDQTVSFRLEYYMNETTDQEDRIVDGLLLKQAMQILSEEENKILYYKFWECLTVREIAKKLDKPRSTIQYKIEEILKKLKKYCDLGD